MLPKPLIELSLLLPSFFLVAIRVSGIMITAPLYGSTAIPARLKAAIVLVISAAMFPVLAPALPTSLGLGAVLYGLVGELSIGLLIGVSLSIVVLATQMTGMIVGQQAGLALASAFDPATEVRSTVIGQVYFFAATALFLIIGGHRTIIQALMASFETIPVMTFHVRLETVAGLSALLMSALCFALKMASPMIITLLVVKAGLGFLSRTMPQLHILSVGFALFVSVGMVLSGWAMMSLYDVLVIHLSDAWDVIRDVLLL